MPPIPESHVRRVIEEELDEPIDQVSDRSMGEAIWPDYTMMKL